MKRNVRALAIVAVGALTLAACGGSDDSSSAATTNAGATSTAAASSVTTTVASSAATTTVAVTATTTTASAAATTTGATATGSSANLCASSTAPAAGATAVAVTMVEWEVKSATNVKAGPLAITVSNQSNNPHEFVIIKADSYATLAKSSNGAVDETALAAGALIGRTGRLTGGTTCVTGFTLTAGNYVFLCNINSGPNSHAAKGQTLSVTVA